MTMSMEIGEDSITSISSETNMTESQKTPETEIYRSVELNPEMLDRKIQSELQEVVLSPEVMSESLKYWSGINVMGGVVNPMLLASRKEVQEMAERDVNEVANALESAGINYSGDPIGTVERLFRDKSTKEQEIRSLERQTIDDIGARRIRLHFDESITHLSTIESLFDDDGNIKESEKSSELYAGFTQLVEYVKGLEKQGARVEIALGPGVKHTERSADKRHVYSVTEYELPAQEADIRVWERYCKGVARNFPNSDMTVWVEPNYDEFVKGGRDPARYAEAVYTAARSVQEVDANKKVGMSMLFLDQDFALETLKHIDELGSIPGDIVGYITFNPYRWGAPEAATWTEGARDRVFRKKAKSALSLETYNTYEDEITTFYKRLAKYNINDIRVGESGYDGDGYTAHENAVCNIRTWVLDRYLWVRETPWRAIQKEGSDSNRGLVSEQGVPTENYNAYRHFNEIFTPDVVSVGEITDPVDRRVYCKIFKNKRTGEDIVALWTAQTYDPKEEVFQRRFTLNVPSDSRVRQVSGIWAKEPSEISVDSTALKDEGVTVGEDPVFLIGNLGFPE